jgi:hypothetical protein
LMFLLMQQSVSLMQILLHSSFSFLELSYELISHNVFKHVVHYGVMVWFQIVFFHRDISAWMGTLFQKQRRWTPVMDALVRPISTSLHIFVPFAS